MSSDFDYAFSRSGRRRRHVCTSSAWQSFQTTDARIQEQDLQDVSAVTEGRHRPKQIATGLVASARGHEASKEIGRLAT